ncbi:recombinase family protein [Ralstonia nicotianae]|uniref:recombinase family protein n=1 Tax=Ralstonia pseudosolanacearum TaxID=1310165 RepID=UPI001403FBBC|nr:recombinase family protein [Ralstonia pseudosolanacearum]KAF3458038.1 resolvase (resP) [Ralstonia solanacearum]NKA81516.1 resolvase (resP) [Ralstonia solanacearum]NKG02222.1 resolvase (resP) [Ralstonia solanacearum]UNJ33213.1 recombinase family protein [Ralstonia pseudosolanacearum]
MHEKPPESRPRYIAYLRVSTTDQNPENQKLGLLEYANSHGFAPVEIVEETVTRKRNWRERALGTLLDSARPGDVFLSPEITRIGGSPYQVLDFLHAAREKGVHVHITKQRIVLDDSLTAEIQATVLGLAARIESHFISTRTKEALQVAKAKGKPIGRQPGTKVRLKLDDKAELVAAYLGAGLSLVQIAARCGVGYATVKRYVKRRKIEPNKNAQLTIVN